MTFKCDSRVLVPCVALGLIGAGAASAQDPAGAVLEEITVTAQKREERLQDVPAAVTAFSADRIADAGIERPKDFTT